MNKALNLKNWKIGGEYYVLRATSFNKWVGFQETAIEELKQKFGDDFFIVICSDESIEDDFYNIPFKKLKHLFTDQHKTAGNTTKRWTAIIQNDNFLMHSNSHLAVNIKEDYGNLHTDDEHSLFKQVDEDLQIVELENEYFEGEKKLRLSNYYERNSKLRIEAIKAHGLNCKICGFNFKKYYGENGAGFIEVHHLVPVCKLEKSTRINPVTDMTVLCANCHRMLHRSKDNALSPAQLKNLLDSSSNLPNKKN